VRQEPGQLVYTVQVQQTPPGVLTFHARLPEWAHQPRVLVNHQPADVPIEQGYLRLERAWQAGDQFQLVFPMQVRIVRGQRLGWHVLSENEAAVFYGPWLFSVNDALNPSIRLHLVKIKLLPDSSRAFKVISADRLEAAGSTPDRTDERLVLSPLASTGGGPSGAGRIHTVRSPYYRVWLPVEKT
jgi:DUF1680 family protein